MMNIRIFRCGGNDTVELVAVQTFEEVAEVIELDILDLKEMTMEEDEWFNLCWYIEIADDKTASVCNSFEYTVRRGWVDKLCINDSLVKKLNELQDIASEIFNK